MSPRLLLAIFLCCPVLLHPQDGGVISFPYQPQYDIYVNGTLITADPNLVLVHTWVGSINETIC